jgi:hypothetical protein
VRIDTGIGPFQVMINHSILSFARNLRSVEDAEQASRLLTEIDTSLDEWENSSEKQMRHGHVSLPFGIEVQLPPGFERR